RIVDGVREEESGGAVGAPNDEVANVVAQKALLPMHEVRELDALAAGHAESCGGRDAGGTLALLLVWRQVAACARVSRRLAARELRSARHLELHRRAEARISQTVRRQRVEVPGVDSRAL